MGRQTRERLLQEAAKLFAEQGFRGVSVRDVTGVAEANVASVSYHFGSQQGLIEAVHETYLMPVLSQREANLQKLSSRVALRELLKGWMQSLIESAQASELGADRFFSLNLSALEFGRREQTEFSKSRAKLCKDCDRLAAASLPGLAEGTRRWRLHWALELLERSLVRGEDLKFFIGRVPTKIPLDDLVEKLLDYAEGGICAPVARGDGLKGQTAKSQSKSGTSRRSSRQTGSPEQNEFLF